MSPFWSRRRNFYPRPPRGGRPLWLSSGKAQKRFLSTPSARRATKSAGCPHGPVPFLSTPSARRATGWDVNESIAGLISIHALREEGDRNRPETICTRPYFYPRPPRGGRRTHPASSGRAGDFYPRPPRGGRPSFREGLIQHGGISIHALREEGDQTGQPSATTSANFYPRPPRGGRQIFRSGSSKT